MWWYRCAAGVASAVVALFMLAESALAGGWAVTTMDELPEGGFQAGQTYRLGYMIRQHGQTPFPGAKTAIQITSASSGESIKYAGVADVTPGHYIAEVTFPSEGEWSWEVSQYPFAVQTLGTVTVVPVASASPGSDAKASLAAPADPTMPPVQSALAISGLDWLPVALPLGLLLVVGLLVWPLSRLVRQRRITSAVRSSQPALHS
jgi:hypothetical protein